MITKLDIVIKLDLAQDVGIFPASKLDPVMFNHRINAIGASIKLIEFDRQ